MPAATAMAAVAAISAGMALVEARVFTPEAMEEEDIEPGVSVVIRDLPMEDIGFVEPDL